MVVRHVEDSQIGKVAKLLGKAAYRKKRDYQHKITRSDRVLSSLPSRLQLAMMRFLRFVRAPHSDGIPPVNF